MRNGPALRTPLPVPIGTSALARALELMEKSGERPTVPKANGGTAMPVAAEQLAPVRSLTSELRRAALQADRALRAAVAGRQQAYDIVHCRKTPAASCSSPAASRREICCSSCTRCCGSSCARRCSARRSRKTPADASDVPVEIERRDARQSNIRVVAGARPGAGLSAGRVRRCTRDAVTGRGDRGRATRRPTPVAQHLERELETTKSQLRDTVEQYEASTEELKASNEELQAMNEELRSATEELETSREELQSINEELTTVNQELKNKVDELGSLEHRPAQT